MTLRVAVDLGTSGICAAMSCDGAPPQVVEVDGAPVAPTAVYAAPDGRLLVGAAAQQQAGIDPARYEPHPGRRIDEGELLLGDTVVPVLDVLRAVLARMVSEARRAAAGAPVDQLVLTHPAGWGPLRPAVLRQAAAPLARQVMLIPEPVAATLYPTPGTWATPDIAVRDIAVLHIGAGTVEASVVRCRAGAVTPLQGCTVLATRGDPAFGGADIDQALLDYVATIATPVDPAAWQALAEGREPADRHRRRVLLTDIRAAKETLSRQPYTDLPLPPPFPDVHLTRADLEGLTAPALGAAVALLEAVLADAGYGPGAPSPAGVFLVGGSTRIPLLARLVHERIGIVPHAFESPETVVALGAAHPVGQTRPVSGDAGDSPHHHSRVRSARLLIAGVLTVGVAVLGGAVTLAVGGTGDGPADQRLARYGYSFALAPGWAQAGGDPGLREVRLVPDIPVGAAGDVGEVLVQENRLNYDTDIQPQRSRRELQSRLAAAEPGRYTAFDPDAGFAGRDVVHYRQRPADGSIVDWYVLFRGQTQVSVGCRYTPAVAGQVERACREVVRTLRIR